MAVVFLSPVSTVFQFLNDALTSPLAGGKLSTYLAGTTTPTPTWTDATGTVQNANPIILNAAGRLPNAIWQAQNTPIKVVVTDANNNPIGSPFDNVRGIGDIASALTVYYANDSGVAANVYVLNFVSSYSSLIDGQLIYWKPQFSNTGASTVNVNSLGALPIVNPDGSSLGPNQIIAGQISQIIYQAVLGKFVLLTNAVFTGTFTGTLTGVSAGGTGTIAYRIFANGLVALSGSFTGTSNSTALTMTGLPAVVTPPFTGSIVRCLVTDNGNALKGGWASVNTAGVITFAIGTDFNPTGFTGGGTTKGLGSSWNILYPLW